MSRGRNNKQIGFYLPDDLSKKVQKKIESSTFEISLSSVLRALLKKWVAGEIKL